MTTRPDVFEDHVTINGTPPPPTFPPGVTRRLQALHATAIGAQAAADAADQVARGTMQRYREAITDACEQLEVAVPPGPFHIDVDFRTGAFSLRPE